MKRRIYLMRHGDVEYFTAAGPPADAGAVPLTARGREQASAAGRALREVAFDRVVTSGLPRTVQTARLVLAETAAGTAPAVEEWPEFEEFHAGRPESVADDDIDEAFLSAFRGAAPREAAYLYGENVGSLVDRVNAGLDRLRSDESWHTVLLVLHGGVNRAILSRALTDRAVFFGHLEQSPACINVIDLGPGWYVRAVNTTPYDVAHSGPRTTSVEEVAEQYRAYRRSDAGRRR